MPSITLNTKFAATGEDYVFDTHFSIDELELAALIKDDLKNLEVKIQNFYKKS